MINKEDKTKHLLFDYFFSNKIMFMVYLYISIKHDNITFNNELSVLKSFANLNNS